MFGQERISWVSLAVTLIINGWYFGYVFSLPAGTNLLGPQVALFAVSLIVPAILMGIAGEVLMRWGRKAAREDATEDASPLDERDVFIGLKAGRNAYRVLAISVALILGQFFAGPLAPDFLAQLLLLALNLAVITVYASRIIYYRRGY